MADMKLFGVHIDPPTAPSDAVYREVKIFVDGSLFHTRIVPVDQQSIDGLRAPATAQIRAEVRDLCYDPCPAGYTNIKILDRGNLLYSDQVGAAQKAHTPCPS